MGTGGAGLSARRRLWTAGLAGGIALFVWGFVTWSLFPLTSGAFRTLPNEDRVAADLKDRGLAAGVYVFPGLPDLRGRTAEQKAEAVREREEKLRRGPVGVLVFDPQGTTPNRMFWPLARGLAFALAAAGFSGWALSRVGPASYLGRAAFVLALGLFAWALGPGTQWAWFNYPSDYLLATLIDGLGGWLIVGLVQAGILRRGESRET
jgi:hypothetical protein